MATWDKTTIIVSAVVGSLGVLSVSLGVAAEAQLFPNLGLVICAGIFLMAAQITVAAVSGCYGCCKSRAISSGTKQIVGIVCAIFSWLVAVIVLALLLIGFFEGMFAGIGVLGITSYILMRSEPKGAEWLAVQVAATGPNNGPSQQQPPVPGDHGGSTSVLASRSDRRTTKRASGGK